MIVDSRSAFDLLQPVLGDLPYEEFWLLLLDRGNRLMNRCKVSQGGMHGTVADPKLIFREALDQRASSVILCHNHPSGQLRPSAEDIQLTRKLVEGGRFLDITVQDHLIVTDGRAATDPDRRRGSPPVHQSSGLVPGHLWGVRRAHPPDAVAHGPAL